ncbi:MAG: hypothetical protein QOE88_232 [Verrucomicrobiota bacterium]|nr:hypothetical protein [Verrucomicrobiota bacterium]
MAVVVFDAWVGASVEKKPGWNRIADRPAHFAVKCFDLRISSVLWVSLNDRVSPETTVIRSFDIDK